MTINRKQRRAEAKQPGQQAFTEAIRLHQAGRLAEAVVCYRRSLALHPAHAEAQQNLGSALSDLGQLDDAIACFDRALALRPGYPVAHLNRGNALWAQGRGDEAAKAYGTAIALKPDFAEAYNFLAIVLGEAGQLGQALAACRRALALQPGYAEAHNTLGNLLRTVAKPAEAVSSYRRAIALAPSYPDGHFNLGMALLALGEMAEGWREYEWRWKTVQMIAAARRFSKPQWQGEAGDGRSLLLHAEQGSGDALQFCRYAPLAAARGFRVVLEAPKPLVRLFRSLAGVDQVVVQGEPLPDFDLHCPMLSLPLVFGTTLATVPRDVPYLTADDAAVGVWRERLGDSRLRVGLAWAGNPSLDRPSRAAMDRRRSLAPERLGALFAVEGVQFVSLQKDGPRLPANLSAVDVMEEMGDFADTAALVAALDLVISVDTAVAHLAGALGKPVWLLDRFDPCWRWLTDRQDSPWYPTLRLYRQPRAGDWDSVLADVARDLTRLPSV